METDCVGNAAEETICNLSNLVVVLYRMNIGFVMRRRSTISARSITTPAEPVHSLYTAATTNCVYLSTSL